MTQSKTIESQKLCVVVSSVFNFIFIALMSASYYFK